MRIVTESRIEEYEDRSLFFQDPDWPEGSGLAFPCAPDGAIDLAELPPAAQKNLARARAEGWTSEVVTHHWHTRIPAIGLCDCGREVVLSGSTNTCDCGADYNSSGQRLAPRSQWGEETGESLADILAIP